MHKKIMFVGLPLVIGFLLLVLGDLIPFWMPMMGELVALTVVTVLLLVWAGLIVAEATADERDVQITMLSGRLAYVSGLLMLALALVVQGITHEIDPWIPVTLAVMVGAKLLGRLYFDR